MQVSVDRLNQVEESVDRSANRVARSAARESRPAMVM